MLNYYKNPKLIESFKQDIDKKAENLSNINLMEVCGTHTMSIAKYGLRDLLPNNINLISGPGCPVCVTPNSAIDKMIALSKIPNVIIATFGDMMRVPGSSSSLIEQQAQGANIKIVYSPLDALEIAKNFPDKQVVFLGIGFETTTPTTAAAIKRAGKQNLSNFSVFCAHKNMPGALNLIANDTQVKVDGFILPGHVSSITGLSPYKFLADEFKIPGVVAGFEAIDIISAIDMLVTQITHNDAKIENAYKRGVKDKGNTTALGLINEVFENCDSQWRGLSNIENSGYKIRDKFSSFDAELKFEINTEKIVENKACKCGDVLKGIIKPKDCPLFAKICNPQNPIGPCMVSNEGSCSASYKYR